MLSRLERCNCFRNPAHDSRQIENPQEDQHQANRQFHRETNPGWNHQAKQNDCRTNKENSDGVTQAPEDSNQGGLPNTPLAAHDRGHSDNMVGIGGVAHAEKKAESNNGK